MVLSEKAYNFGSIDKYIKKSRKMTWIISIRTSGNVPNDLQFKSDLREHFCIKYKRLFPVKQHKIEGVRWQRHSV